VGLGAPEDHLYGAQVEIEKSNGSMATIFVGKNIAPGAFAWAVPTAEGRLRLGLVTSREPRTWLLHLLKTSFPEEREGFLPETIRVKAIAQGLVSRTHADRVIAVGEAAGQVKTTTGGGIYFGLLCSRIAADVISRCHQAGSFSAHSLSVYDKTWREAIQKEILVGHYARRIFSLFSDAQIERLIDLAKTDGIIPLIQTKGQFDWQSGLLLELAKKVPPLSYFNDIRKKLDLFDRFLS
jgi:digeranylgeranylglycerophospholipid reductase